MLNVWWKSNMAWKYWIEGLQRWKRRHSLHTTKVPISHADIIFWHQRTAQKSKRPFRVWVWKCRTTVPALWAAMQLPCLFMCLCRSSLTGVDVTAHALRCLLDCSSFLPLALDGEQTRGGFANDVLKANQPIRCHLSPPQMQKRDKVSMSRYVSVHLFFDKKIELHGCHVKRSGVYRKERTPL